MNVRARERVAEAEADEGLAQPPHREHDVLGSDRARQRLGVEPGGEIDLARRVIARNGAESVSSAANTGTLTMRSKRGKFQSVSPLRIAMCSLANGEYGWSLPRAFIS